jgi:outer membrane lipoprotein SlyB
MRRLLAATLLLAALSGCGPSHSPNTYSVIAVQQANTVAQGVIIGLRSVNVSAAVGRIAGSQAMSGPVSAFTALDGGVAGSAAEHTTADTTTFEYIVRKANGNLVSVTQKDKTPLALGQKVLVIAGNQARVVPDYTVPPEAGGATAAKPPKAEAAPAENKSAEPAKAETTPTAVDAPAKPAGTPDHAS